MKDGETIVIGGLTQKQEYVTHRKTPILGSLPLVGPLFQSRAKSTANTELLILITPRLLTKSERVRVARDEPRPENVSSPRVSCAYASATN